MSRVPQVKYIYNFAVKKKSPQIIQHNSFFFLGERAKVHFVSRRVGGSKWITSEFNVVRLSDNKSVEIGTPDLTETGEPVIEKQ